MRYPETPPVQSAVWGPPSNTPKPDSPSHAQVPVYFNKCIFWWVLLPFTRTLSQKTGIFFFGKTSFLGPKKNDNRELYQKRDLRIGVICRNSSQRQNVVVLNSSKFGPIKVYHGRTDRNANPKNNVFTMSRHLEKL